MSARERWARTWPALLAVGTVTAVGGPAAVASYRHARDVIARAGDPVMAPWLALTTDGMLLAALVVIWVRRHRGEATGRGPWAAFWAGMAATIAANLAAAQPTVEGVVVALWPPVCLAITLELVALVAHRAAPRARPIVITDMHEVTDPPEWWAEAPEIDDDQDDDSPAIDRAPAGDGPGDRTAELIAAGAGRRRLARELDITEHEARALLARHRPDRDQRGDAA